MKKTFVLSVLVLLLASGLVWSASASATGDQASADAEQVLKQYDSAHGAVEAAKPPPPPPPPPPGPCTVSCWIDPNDPSAPPLSCTSETGNCVSGGKGSYFFIQCDGGPTIVCPEYW